MSTWGQPVERHGPRPAAVTSHLGGATAEPAAPEGERSLLARARAGSYEAFEALVAQYSGRVYQVCRAHLQVGADVEEAVQETFLHMFQGLGRFREESQLRTWIYRIAVNAALQRRRKQKKYREVAPLATTGPDVADEAPAVPEPASSAPPPSAEAERAELRARIQAAVDELDEKYRVVFVLRDVNELSVDETAELLGLTSAAVKSRLHRARLSLRATLERYVERR